MYQSQRYNFDIFLNNEKITLHYDLKKGCLVFFQASKA